MQFEDLYWLVSSLASSVQSFRIKYISCHLRCAKPFEVPLPMLCRHLRPVTALISLFVPQVTNNQYISTISSLEVRAPFTFPHLDISINVPTHCPATTSPTEQPWPLPAKLSCPAFPLIQKNPSPTSMSKTFSLRDLKDDEVLVERIATGICHTYIVVS